MTRGREEGVGDTVVFPATDRKADVQSENGVGLNKVYSLDIVRLKHNTISYTRSLTAYMSTTLTLNTHDY